MQKRAMFDPVSLAAEAAILHVGANQAAKLWRWFGHKNNAVGRKVRAIEGAQFAKAFTRRMEGKSTSIGPKFVESAVAPEFTVPSELGNAVADNMRKLTPHQRKSDLKRLRKALATTPELHHLDGANAMIHGVNKLLAHGQGLPIKDRAKLVGERDFSAIHNPALLLGGAAVVSQQPHALAHFGINKIRAMLAKSKTGADFAKNQASEAAERRLLDNVGFDSNRLYPWQRAKDLAIDNLVSPAARDPARVVDALAGMVRKDLLNPDKSRSVPRALAALDGPLMGGKLRKSMAEGVEQERKRQAQEAAEFAIAPDKAKKLEEITARRVSGANSTAADIVNRANMINRFGAAGLPAGTYKALPSEARERVPRQAALTNILMERDGLSLKGFKENRTQLEDLAHSFLSP